MEMDDRSPRARGLAAAFTGGLPKNQRISAIFTDDDAGRNPRQNFRGGLDKRRQ
jgi:hypothetical protein